MDTAWIALIGTLFGGVALKVMERVMSRGTEKIDLATKMRDELRKDLSSAKEDIRGLEKDIDLWKEKYFVLLQEHLELKSEGKGPVARGGDSK